MIPFRPIITSLRSNHVPLLHPLSLLMSIQTLMALRRRWWPLTPSISLDFPLAMISKISDVSPVTSSLLIVVVNTATFRLFHASIHHIEGFSVAIATAEGGSAVLRQFLSTIRIIFTPVRGRFGTILQPIGMYQRQPCITQQSNGVGVRFLCGGDGVGSFIRGIMPDFYILVHKKNGVKFHLLWY